jgi:hypothetical protein
MSGSDRDSSPPNGLDDFQLELLEAFFQRERRFFLTGGAALTGFHLRHRRTLDLDLFTTEDILAEGARALTDAARELGAEVESLRTSPGFLRFVARRRGAAVVIDLVRDSAPQAFAEKASFGPIRVDPPAEILANKLCTLLSRAELRDLVDVRALEQAGFRVEDALGAAMRKDAGLTAGQLAWVLSEIEIGDDARPPGGVTAPELRAYLADLVARLARLAFPGR